MMKNRIDGVLLLDKPVGITSNGALVRAKRAYGAAKAGHTGTLDPLASGLLPICFGEATKFASDLLTANKRYMATVALGQVTTTGDAEGEVIQTLPVSVDGASIETALSTLRGEIQQIPPMHSALKRDGKPLYAYARAGLTLTRDPRTVSIYDLTLVASAQNSLTLDVTCSKGTYIRVLAEQIGAALGCGAHLASLRRTSVGVLSLTQAVTLDTLEAMQPEGRLSALLPSDSLLQSLPRIDLDQDATTRFRHGQCIAVALSHPLGRVRVYGSGIEGVGLLGTAQLGDQGALMPLRLVAESHFPAQETGSTVPRAKFHSEKGE